MFLRIFFQLVATVIIISIASPWFILVIIPLIIFYGFIQVILTCMYRTAGYFVGLIIRGSIQKRCQPYKFFDLCINFFKDTKAMKLKCQENTCK